MNITSTSCHATDAQSSRALHELAANQARSAELPAGAAIRCIDGRVWLTQEGDARDHVVPAGTVFCTDRAGRVVVSAVDGRAVVAISRIAPPGCVRGSVRVESVQRFKRAAESARAEYMARMFVGCVESLLRWMRRFARRPFSA